MLKITTPSVGIEVDLSGVSDVVRRVHEMLGDDGVEAPWEHLAHDE